MEIRPIRTELDYQSALKAVAPYFDLEPEPGSIEADRFELLLMVIEAYEARHHAINAPDPIEAIKFRMEQAGLTPKDLRPMIGETNRVYEILNYTRPLTLPMIRRLNASLGIPADALIGEPKLCRGKANKGITAANAKLTKHTKIADASKLKATKSTKQVASKTSARKAALSR